MPSKPSTQKLTDLCCCVNAHDSYCAEFLTELDDMEKHRKRERNTLCGVILDHAQVLFNDGVSLKRLRNALVAGGWDDNYFVIDPKTNTLKIEYRF